MKTREDYENLINGSIIFSIDREKDYNLYNSEKLKFNKLVCDYYLNCILNKKIESGDAEEYSDKVDTFFAVLIESIDACLKSYKSDKGVFLHYLNKVLGLNRKKEQGKESWSENSGGVTLTRDDDKIRRLILKNAQKCREFYCSQYGKEIDLLDSRIIKYVSINCKLPLKDVEYWLTASSNAKLVKNEIRGDDDEEETSIFEFIPDNIANIEQKHVEEDSLREMLDIIEEVFSREQQRTQRVISALFTVDILAHIDDDGEYMQLLSEYSFFSDEVAEMCAKYKKVTRREVYKLLGISEASGSRTYKNFIEKLKKEF